MKIINLCIVFILLFILIPTISEAGQAYYVDCSQSRNGNGSFLNPWNNISAVNNHAFDEGDDVYFKVGTQCDVRENLRVDWSGTDENDRVIIGAYYGDKKFGLNGNHRPIIDGDTNDDGTHDIPTGGDKSQSGLIDINNPKVSYVTVRDLQVQYSLGSGIAVKQADHVNVDNCYVWRSYWMGIVYSAKYYSDPERNADGVEYGNITNNIVIETKWPDYPMGGANITVTSTNMPLFPQGHAKEGIGRTHHIRVANNYVARGSAEGIGLYQLATDCIVEYNVVQDIRIVGIYIDKSKRNKIRYNLVYASNISGHRNLGGPFFMGIGLDNEYGETSYCGTINSEIYGNLISNVKNGIRLLNNLQKSDTPCTGFGDLKIYNNTIVDSESYNIYIDGAQLNGSDNIQIKNNISYLSGEIAGRHTNLTTSKYVTWDSNLWNGGVSGEAAGNQLIGDPQLTKSSGWRSLTPDELDGTEFMPIDGSPVINKGIIIDGYDKLISRSKFSPTPINVEIEQIAIPHLGAYINNSTVKSNFSGNQDSTSDSVIIDNAPSLPPPPVVSIQN